MVGVEQLFGPEWSDLAYLKTSDAREIFGRLFMDWARQHDKAWLYREGQKRLIPLAPVSTPADLLQNPQLHSRGHFVEFTHPLLIQAARMPGAPYVMSGSPWRVSRPAPSLGQHTAEIVGEIGISAADLSRLYSMGVLA